MNDCSRFFGLSTSTSVFRHATVNWKLLKLIFWEKNDWNGFIRVSQLSVRHMMWLGGFATFPKLLITLEFNRLCGLIVRVEFKKGSYIGKKKGKNIPCDGLQFTFPWLEKEYYYSLPIFLFGWGNLHTGLDFKHNGIWAICKNLFQQWTAVPFAWIFKPKASERKQLPPKIPGTYGAIVSVATWTDNEVKYPFNIRIHALPWRIIRVFILSANLIL